MVDLEHRQAMGNHFPTGALPNPIPHQSQAHNHHDAFQQDLGVPPVALNGQLEDPLDPMARDQPGMHDLRSAYDGILDYRPQPPHDPPVPYVFPDVGILQGIPAQRRANPPENQEQDILDFAPQHVPPFPVQALLPDPVAHQILAPGQPAAENLRQLAIRFLHRPDSQVDLVSMEPGAAGLCRVVIVLALADVL